MVSKIFFQTAFCIIIGAFRVVQALPANLFQDLSSDSQWNIGRAIYFQTNEFNNSIVALKISENGTLSQGSITSTGGVGASSISSATNITASPDGLSSQGSVIVVGSNLFVVNAGDNTVSAFLIDRTDPTIITLLGSPVEVPGDFPVTVAASPLNGLVCVGTSGTRAGVSCGPYSPYVGIGQFDFLRPFDLNQSNPPSGPLNTVSQTYFSDDESLLITTVKGDPTANKTGFVSVFSVSGPSPYTPARVSAGEVRSIINGTVALFGFQQIPDSNNYFVVDASFGATILSLDEETESSYLLHKTTIPDQMATCWVLISPYSNTAFVTDVSVNHIVEMSLIDASIVSTVNTTSSNDASGYIDLVAVGEYVYALSPGGEVGSNAEVGVLSLSRDGLRPIIQSFNLGELAGSSSQGLASFT